MPTHTGKVYDLDFITCSGACQALITDGPDLNIVVVTSEHRMQTILETSMVLDRDVEVDYELGQPNRLTRVKLNLRSIPIP